MIISRTPLRVSLFGGGTDYREYYLRRGGAVLGMTIDKYVYTSINRLSPFFEYKIRVSYSKSELVQNVGEIIHPSVRECLKFKGINDFLDVHIFSDLPARTGLGSSSSFTVGFLNALGALEGKLSSKALLAEEACRIEQEILKENVGSQDQVHAAFGGLNIIEFDASGFHVRPWITQAENRELLEKSLMIFYTGQTRLASEVLEEQVAQTKTGDKDAYLDQMKKMVFEAEALSQQKSGKDFLVSLGELLHQSWELKKQLSSQVSNSRIDEAYARAREVGALGGKILGAGSGGFLALLVSPEQQPLIRMVLRDWLELKFRFENTGSTIIYYQ